MVVTPYLSGLNTTIVEWSQYHIGFSIKRVVLVPYCWCNSGTVFNNSVVNRTGGVVDSLDSATKHLKESDMFVTKPSNNFGKYSLMEFGNPKTNNLEIQKNKMT